MTHRINFVLSIFVIVLFVSSCIPPEKKELTEVNIDLTDSIYRNILDFQDKRLTDSLIKYFNNNDPSYRYASILAFSSVLDTNVTDAIIKKLNDKVPKVREVAAYTLGQLGKSKAQDSLLASFGKYDTIYPNNVFNSNILEAIGKIGDLKYLQPLATVKSYRPTDTLLLLGQTRGLYRYIIRGMSVPEGTEKIIDFISSNIYPDNIRILSSFYLIRAKKKDLNNYKYRIAKIFKKETNSVIKMNLAIALGKTKDSSILKDMIEVLNNTNTNSDVRVNIIKAFGNFNYIDVAETVLKKLEDNDNPVALAAAQYFYDFGEPNDVVIYRKTAKKDLDWNVKAKLYSAILKHVPIYFSKTKSATLWDIKKHIINSENTYEKVEYIRALGEDINSFKNIYELGFKAPEIPVRTASVEALGIFVQKETLTKLPKWKSKKLKEDISTMILEAFNSGDVGLIASATEVMEKSVLDFNENFENLDFISKSKSLLTLPKDVEAYNAVLKLESKLFHKKYNPVKMQYNHPIDWTLFDKLSDSTTAIVRTNKGDFTMKFFKNESPGSVTNFVKLAEDKFFEGKKFHRVVSNFVVQTGCPRGDGYGSLNYTIRSELGPLYYDETGYVGMASAGKNTESTQWFVTLAPTPHLDGRYTIFAKVIKGMDIVKNIRIGDIINSVEIMEK